MKKKKILIVVSRYNKLITKGLEKTAIDHLSQHRGFENYLTEAPGAFEIPFIILKCICSKSIYISKNMMELLLLVVLLKEKQIILN